MRPFQNAPTSIRPVPIRFTQQPPRDQPPGDHEEGVDAQIPAGESVEVEQHDGRHSERAKTVETRAVPPFRGTRHVATVPVLLGWRQSRSPGLI